MIESIRLMVENIVAILDEGAPSIYLYGSVVLNDFRLGWSDIDFLCVTQKRITDKQARQLLNLRQHLLEQDPNNEYFRSFEGAFLTFEGLIYHKEDTVVYWGTSGEKIKGCYELDPFSKITLIDKGLLLYGVDIRTMLKYPTEQAIYDAIVIHYQTIRTYAVTTQQNLYSIGWSLDIARCLYTLKTGRIISKTEGGVWALDHNLVPNPENMKRILEIRRQPNRIIHNKETLKWFESQGPMIQEFANVLEEALKDKCSKENTIFKCIE